MKDASETLISSGTLVHKFILPGMLLGGVLGFGVVSAFYAEPLVIIWIALVTFTGITGGLLCLLPYHVPLKQVWLGKNHFRITNLRTDLRLPYTAVESVGHCCLMQPRYVVVTLREETIYGRRFTFVPRHFLAWSTSPAEAIEIVEFRGRVETAENNAIDSKLRPLLHFPGRSIMADDEFDGPL